MPRANDWNAPCCPICAHDLAHNGKTKNGKVRWRCCHCKEYNETVGSIAHNANKRTSYGVEELSKLVQLGVYNKTPTLTKPNKRQDNCPPDTGFRQPQICSFLKPKRQ